MTDKEQKELEFAHSEAANAIQRYFEVAAEKRKLQGQLAALNLAKEAAVASARIDTAKTIFKEMYAVVSESADEAIIVTAEDIKAIAKRYGVKL